MLLGVSFLLTQIQPSASVKDLLIELQLLSIFAYSKLVLSILWFGALG